MQKLSLCLPTQTTSTRLSRIKLSFTLLAVTLCTPALHANINNIKGTYDILKDTYKHFSVIHGAVAWETGTIRRMYDLGALGKKAGQIESKTIQLVHQLFYRVPESTGITDFVIAEKINTLADREIIPFIADSLLYLENFAQTESYKKYQDIFESYKTADEKKKPSLKRLIGSWRVKIGEEAKKNPSFEAYDAPLKNILPFIMEAALECLIENYMPPYTPQLILLGLLYKKTGCSRNMLETYYQHIQTKIDCLYTPTDWEAWKENIFKKEDFDIFFSELLASSPTDETDNSFYEKYVYISLSPTNYPPMISYATAGIDPTIDCKKTKHDHRCFADCMDTTLRNLVNVLAYNPQTKLFDSSLLEIRLGFAVPQFLKDFYQKNPDPVLASDATAHSDWAQLVISNIPFAAYNKTLPKTSQREHRGFIKIGNSSAELKEFLKQKHYSLVEETTLVYEIKASLQNLIIALNHIFGLNLFETDLAQEFMKDNFIQTYLPKMAAKLKATIPDSFDLKNSDKNDFTSQKIALPLNFVFEQQDGQSEPYKASVITKTTEGHGEIILKIEEETQGLQLKHTFSSEALSNLLLTSYTNFYPQEDSATIEPLTFFSSTSTVFLWLFSQPIDDPDKAFDLVQTTPFMDDAIYTLFLFLARKNADIKIKSDMIFSTYQAALRTGFAENESILKEIIDAAQKGIYSTDIYDQENAINLFSTLISQNKALDEALLAIKIGMQSKELSTHVNTLNLFTSLVYQNKAFDEALNAAKIAIKSSNWMVKQAALNIFSALASKDKNLEEALDAAKIGITSSNKITQQSALTLFSLLVSKDKAFDEALNAAKIGITSSDEYAQQSALNIFSTLVSKDKAFDEALDAAKIGITSSNEYIKREALHIFANLASNNRALNEALEHAKIGIQSSDIFVKGNALEIFSGLVRNDRNFDEALAAAKIGIQSPEIYLQGVALNILSTLVDKKKALDKALEIAKIGLLSSTEYTRSFSDLLIKQIEAASPTKKAIESLTEKDPQWTDKIKEASKKLKLIKDIKPTTPSLKTIP